MERQAMVGRGRDAGQGQTCAGGLLWWAGTFERDHVLDELGGVERLWAVPISLAVSVDVGLVFVITVVAAGGRVQEVSALHLTDSCWSYLSTTVGQILLTIDFSFLQNTLFPPPLPPATPITSTLAPLPANG